MVTTVSEFVSAAVSDRGLSESRPENEDSYIQLPEHGLFAVADGVGGAQAGEVASQMAVEILGEAFVNMGENADPEDTMRIALERANEAIYQMSHDLPQLSSMATTIAAVHVSGDMVTIAHVGDSRVYRVDPNGRLFRETDDHSVVEEEVRAGRMTPEQALNHPSRNVISRALGAEETVIPDVKCVLVHPATTFLLCSDGITRHIDDAEIETLLNSEFGPDDICSRMKEICFSRGAEDNLTAVVLRFPGEPQLAAVAPEDDEDIEEVTLAGVRDEVPIDSETVENIELPEDALTSDSDDVGLVESEATEEADDDAYLIESPEAIFSDEPDGEPDTGPQVTASPDEYESVTAAPAHTVSSFEFEPEAASRGSNNFLSMLVLLVIGAVIGTVAGYFAFKPGQPEAAVPIISDQKSNNITLTAFEDTRRTVDRDPTGFLNAEAATPQEAADYFWLGRALLLTGKPVEAKRAYEEARRLLPSSPEEPSNNKVMANEIAMGLAIADDLQAAEAFKKEIDLVNAAVSSTGNTNSSTNGARPVR